MPQQPITGAILGQPGGESPQHLVQRPGIVQINPLLAEGVPEAMDVTIYQTGDDRVAGQVDHPSRAVHQPLNHGVVADSNDPLAVHGQGGGPGMGRVQGVNLSM